MDESGMNRRRLLAGLATAAGVGLTARVAAAFPRSSRIEFHAASQILKRYGVTVRGESAGRAVDHDVLTLEVDHTRRPATEYVHVVGHPSPSGEIVPCLRTSFFNGVEELSLFDPSESEVVPCIRTTRQGGVVTSDHFHPRVSEIIPCVRTTIVGESLATFERFDLTEGDIQPCIRVESEMSADGALGAVRVVVEPDVEEFSVRVGDLLYRLEGGELVLEPVPPR